MASADSFDNWFDYTLHEQTLKLNPTKCVLWKDKKTLIISDLHIGKVMHFRRAGYAIPLDSLIKNFETLSFILLNNAIETVLFLGDLYHSTENNETQLFWEMIYKFPKLKFILVKGNHDVHNTRHFEKKGLEVYDQLEWGPFLFTHEPIPEEGSLYNIAGHIHPAVRLRGKARSFLRLPCFYFKKWQSVLPAFGSFTGSHSITPQKGDQVFAVVNEDKIIDVSIV